MNPEIQPEIQPVIQPVIHPEIQPDIQPLNNTISISKHLTVLMRLYLGIKLEVTQE